jgi:hypothetical protein
MVPALMLLVVLAAIGARRWLEGVAPVGAELVTDPRAVDRADRRRARGGRSGRPVPGAARRRERLSVRVEVRPAGSRLEWRAEVYLQPTRHRDPEQLAAETRRGSCALTWDVPRDRLGVLVTSDGGFGGTWKAVDTTLDGPHELAVVLHAPATLRGRVTGRDGRRLARARVLLVPDRSPPPPRPPWAGPALEDGREGPTVETDADGGYELRGLDPRSTYAGAAALPGYAVRREHGVRLAPGAHAALDFVLDVGCRVTGRLLDSAAQPIARARLRIADGRRSAAGSVRWDVEGAATTAVDGRFVFDCLGPGWKKVQTVLASEPGVSVVGHWERRVGRGETALLGDLLVPDSLFEARIETPEGADPGVRVRFAFVPDLAGGGVGDGALLMVPVVPDDEAVVRVRGLPPGRIQALLRSTRTRDDGRWRPATEVEHVFQGGHEQVVWLLNPLQDGARPDVDHRGEPIVPVTVRLPEREASDVALTFVDGALVAVQRASGGTVGLGATRGQSVRVVVTAGESWGETTLVVAEPSTLEADVPADRPGNTVDVRVTDDGRPVPGALVLVGPAERGEAGLLPLGPTGDDGTRRLSGLPPDVELCVTARVYRQRPPPRTVRWVGGRAAIEIDVGED